jgi:hypothetical protein
MRMPTRKHKEKLLPVTIQNLARQRNLHNHAISTTIYEKKDPWRYRSITSLGTRGKEMVFSDTANNCIRSVVHWSDSKKSNQGGKEC